MDDDGDQVDGQDGDEKMIVSLSVKAAGRYDRSVLSAEQAIRAVYRDDFPRIMTRAIRGRLIQEL